MANNGTECPDPDDPLCPPEFPTVEPPSTPLPGIVALGYTKDLHELLDLHMTLLTELSVMTQGISTACAVQIDGSLSTSVGALANTTYTAANVVLNAQVVAVKAKQLEFFIKYGAFL